MAKRRDSFRLGLTVLIIFGLFVAVLMFIGSGWRREPRVRVVVRFPHTLSLPLMEKGADVIAFGRVVGEVENLHPVEAPHPEKPSAGAMLFLEVEAQVNEGVGLRQDCRIVAEGPPLGGRGYLRIADRGQSTERVSPMKPVYGRAGGFGAALEMAAAEFDPNNKTGLLAMIKTQLDPNEAESLLAKIHVSLGDLNELTHALALQTDPRQKDALITKASAVLDNLDQTTASLREQMTPGRDGVVLSKVMAALDSLNRGLTEAAAMLEENRPHVTHTMQSVERTAATLDSGIAAPLALELDKSNPESLLARVHGSFEKVQTSLDDLNVVTESTRRMVVLNSDRFSQLIENVKETSDHLKATSKDLRRNPWRLLYRPSLEETKELNIFDAAREFSEAAGRLDDAATQLNSLAESQGGSVSADDPAMARIRAHLQETFERFKAAEQALWEQVGKQ